mgnify:FL=1
MGRAQARREDEIDAVLAESAEDHLEAFERLRGIAEQGLGIYAL